MKYVAIDIGSSYIKAAIIDLDEYSIKERIQYEVPKQSYSEDNLRFEVNVEEIYGMIKGILDNYISTFKEEISGITMSTQMHGFLFCDKSGNSVTPYVSWQDNRCLIQHPTFNGTYLDYLSSKISPDDMKYSGLYLKPGLGLCNAYTLVHEKHFNVKEDMLFCTLGSYLIFKLTSEFTCHLSNAAPTGFADVYNSKWNEKLIKSIGFDCFTFPMIKGESEVCGYYRSGYKEIPVFPDLGDQQVAVLGSMLEPVKEVNINIATAAQLSYISSEFIAGNYEIRPYFEGKYLNTVTRIPGGRCINVIIKFINDLAVSLFDISMTNNELWCKVNTMLAQCSSSDLEVEVGFFKDMLGVKEGAVKNINEKNFTISNVLNGAYDNISEIYDKYINYLIPDRRIIERIIFSGGAALKNEHLRNRIETKCCFESALSPLPDEVFLGHFILSMKNEGLCKSIEDARSKLIIDKELNRVNIRLY